MVAGFIKIPQAQTDFDTNIEMTKTKVLSNIDVCNIGIITNFNDKNQTCEIQLMQSKQYMGQYKEPPLLTDIPLFILGTMGADITFPDIIGTYCLVLTCDRNLANFLLTGEIYPPATTRMHNISDSIALCSIRPFNKSLSNYDTQAINIEYQNGNIKVKDEISINSQGKINLNAATQINLDAPMTATTGNLNVGTGYSGVIPCGTISISVSNGIITGVQ